MTAIVTSSSDIAQFDKDYPHFLNPDGSHKLSGRWVLWSHDHDKRGWKLGDYTKHVTMSTTEEFWQVYNGLMPLNNKDMWFLMREGIPPLWEHAINAEGGSFKFRVDGSSVDNTWLTLSLFLISENMCLRPEDASLISGLSISPKANGFATISVWNLDSAVTRADQFPKNISGIDFNMSRYDPHKSRKLGGE